MKDSVLKITALAMLLIVFIAVVITSGWSDEPAYDHISQPGEVTGEGTSKSSSPPQRLNYINEQAKFGAGVSEIKFSFGRAGRPGDNLNVSPADSMDTRPGYLREDSEEGNEPPDTIKPEYGSDDVE